MHWKNASIIGSVSNIPCRILKKELKVTNFTKFYSLNKLENSSVHRYIDTTKEQKNLKVHNTVI